MKITHELADNWFSKLPINVKRNLFSISCEMKAAEEKHPSWPKDVIHMAAIVGEESGELIQATIQHIYEKGQYYSIHKEAIQTAAMCLRMLNNLPLVKFTGESKDKEPIYKKH